MKKAGSRQQELFLTEALRRFCEVEMPARNLSPGTRRGYTYDLSDWVAATPSSLAVPALSTDAIARYLSTLDARVLKGATRHRKVAAIKTFLRYLERDGELPPDFSTRISWPEVQRDEPRALSQPEYTALLREAGHHPRRGWRVSLDSFSCAHQTGFAKALRSSAASTWVANRT